MAKLDFVHSGSITDSVYQAIQKGSRDFHHVRLPGRRAKSRRREPEHLTDLTDRIREGWANLNIPGGLAHRDLALLYQEVGCQSDPGEETQQSRCRAGDGFVRPWALCFHAEMSTDFFKGHFEPPALDKPVDDPYRREVGVGRQ